MICKWMGWSMDDLDSVSTDVRDEIILMISEEQEELDRVRNP